VFRVTSYNKVLILWSVVRLIQQRLLAVECRVFGDNSAVEYHKLHCWICRVKTGALIFNHKIWRPFAEVSLRWHCCNPWLTTFTTKAFTISNHDDDEDDEDVDHRRRCHHRHHNQGSEKNGFFKTQPLCFWDLLGFSDLFSWTSSREACWLT